MLPNEFFQLFVQSRPQVLSTDCKVEFIRSLHTKHSGHSFLQPLVIIFQSQIQNRSLVDFIFPELLPRTDMVGQLCHKEGFSHLWRTGKQICPRIEQAVNNCLLALINCLVQFIHRNRM